MPITSKSEAFTQYYNRIEEFLERSLKIQKHKPFWLLLKEAAKVNRVVAEYQEDLEEYSKLRNAIVHSSTNKTLAEPHDEALQEMRRIYQMLTEPPLAASLFKKDVFTCTIEDDLFHIADIMAKKDYTQVPIYSGSEFKGLVTETSLVKWLSAQGREGAREWSEDLTVQTILPYTSGQFYRFVSAKIDVFTVLDYFLDFVKNKERLECVLITPTGNCDELPIGIATTWDVPLIKKIH